MAIVRTNITLPEEPLALVDVVAGPRGRSRYIADVAAKQVHRDNARMVFEKYPGALKDSGAWGRNPEETDRLLTGDPAILGSALDLGGKAAIGHLGNRFARSTSSCSFRWPSRSVDVVGRGRPVGVVGGRHLPD